VHDDPSGIAAPAKQNPNAQMPVAKHGPDTQGVPNANPAQERTGEVIAEDVGGNDVVVVKVVVVVVVLVVVVVVMGKHAP